MYTILLTGGTGYIGSHTAALLLEKGYRVILLDSLVNSSIKVIDNLKSIFHESNYEKSNLLSFKNCDIRNFYLLDNIFLEEIKKGNPIDAVIHFAGLKSVVESVIDPIKYWDVNLGGTINLIKVMEKRNCRTLVFSSSAAIYSPKVNSLISEEDIIMPSSPYGFTKLAVENLLKNLNQNNLKQNWRIASLRYFNPIGAHSSGLIGEDPAQKPTNIFPVLCEVALNKNKILEVFGNDWPTDDGTCERDFIHVMDLAEAHLAATKYLFHNNPQYVNLNIGTAKKTSILELIKIFNEVNKCEIRYKYSERRNGDLSSVVANNELAIKLLDWEPFRDLKQMCIDGWKWKSYSNQLY